MQAEAKILLVNPWKYAYNDFKVTIHMALNNYTLIFKNLRKEKDNEQ